MVSVHQQAIPCTGSEYIIRNYNMLRVVILRNHIIINITSESSTYVLYVLLNFVLPLSLYIENVLSLVLLIICIFPIPGPIPDALCMFCTLCCSEIVYVGWHVVCWCTLDEADLSARSGRVRKLTRQRIN